MNKKPNIIFRHTISPEVHVAAWASADGVSFSIQKSYWSRKDGAWRKTNSFFAKDLAALLLLCQEALSYNNQFWRNLTPEQREERRRLRGVKVTRRKSLNITTIPVLRRRSPARARTTIFFKREIEEIAGRKT